MLHGNSVHDSTKSEQFFVDSLVKQAVFHSLNEPIYSLVQITILVSMFSSYLHDNTEGGDFFLSRLVFILLEVKMNE